MHVLKTSNMGITILPSNLHDSSEDESHENIQTAAAGQGSGDEIKGVPVGD